MKILNKNFGKILILALALMLTSAVSAQKYAYIDSDYILNNVPEYQDAQNQMDELSEKWQKEIEGKFLEIDNLYKKYQADVVLLPADMKKKREEEIISMEKEVKAYQQEKFGQSGELFQKRQELIKPLQDKIYNAIEEIATTKNYAFIFDKASGATIMYANPKFDISDDVLDELGYSFNTQK
ncbi:MULTISPECIES: OmpH family outer membrane protein [unclassified Lentimicrobium]|uniref:OmpH family outer membrane protein n=1 Tax=unclassified Lentimicrobium TaxID=2677434 RepID=UPI001551CD38|nr:MULTISPECIES: OmpH family outer membrane protein [unclassified Lentimicrobium]NPD45746.1 OmpH family outer membrane protein [Lentimicrobium sp. S6]NPD85106.1 OmpH family outer membrane protein [Lentimicrobium sp. L6]